MKIDQDMIPVSKTGATISLVTDPNKPVVSCGPEEECRPLCEPCTDSGLDCSPDCSCSPCEEEGEALVPERGEFPSEDDRGCEPNT